MVMALFVPYSSTTCTKAMRQRSGIMLAKANQSSLNNFSDRMYLPQTRNIIITAAKHVHHQQTSKVALSWWEDRAGGGDE